MKVLDNYNKVKTKFRKSFKLKIFGIVSVSVLITSALFVASLVIYQRNETRKDMISRGMMMVDFIAQSSKVGVFAENKDMLKDTVSGIINLKDVLKVQILTNDMRVIISEEKKRRNATKKEMSDNLKKMIELSANNLSGRFIETGKEILFVKPIVLEISPASEEALYFGKITEETGQRIIGYASVILDGQALDRKIATITLHNILISTLFFCLCASVIFWALKKFLIPLSDLTEKVQLLGTGKSIEKIPVNTEDEIGRLTDAFNTMTENLLKREKEKESLEKKLRHAQKMEALGNFSRGVAHDFNNILTTIKGALYIIEKDIDENNEMYRYIERIYNSIEKARRLVKGLVMFSRTHISNPEPLKINEIIRVSKTGISDMSNGNIDISLDLKNEDIIVFADAIQIEQMIMNICMNAIDAMPNGGKLYIRTDKVKGPMLLNKIEDGYLEIKSKDAEPNNNFAEVTITDTGTGMDDETRDRMFEPFFTTKDSKKGTGLGLAIVYGIIEQHKGIILVKTAKDKGTEFKIYLPLMEKEDRYMENISGITDN